MDMFTLHIEHAVLLGLFTVLTLIDCLLHNGARAAYWFPAYTLCAFIAAMLVALRGHGVSETASIVYGMTFFHLAYFCLHCGLEGFSERNRVLRWPVLVQLALLLAAVGALIQFAILHPDTGRRAVAYSLVFALQTGLSAALVLVESRGPVAIPGRLMGGLLALLALNNVIRVATTLHAGAPANYLQGGIWLQLSLLETTVLQAGITVAFVWMTAGVLHGKLDRLASTDPLTGLLNRRGLEAFAERELALSRKSMNPLAAILIDLDRFKQINDSFGHPFGDRVLLEVSRCLQDHMRQSDLLARVGGDEFAVLLHGATSERAMEVAERLRWSLEQLVVVGDGMEARISASFGLAQADNSTEDWNELVGKCDKGVYAVKEHGGNLALAQ